MTLKTVTVTGQLYNPDGSPAAGAEGYATLTQYEVDSGIVVPTSGYIKADETGRFEVPLWPNSRGNANSQYIIRIRSRRSVILDVRAIVPDVDVSVGIQSILIAPPWPPVDQSLQALLEVQAARVIVDAARDETLLSEAAAGMSASKAKGSEDAAKISQDKAKVSEDNASESERKAADSETNAAESERLAGLHKVAAGESQANASDSAQLASNKAQLATDKAEAARLSQVAAAQSESNASSHSISTNEDRIAAQGAAQNAADSAGLALDAQADIHTNWQGKLDTAAQQAGIATDKAAEASGSAATANAAKTAAELARDAAMVGAVTYPDEATGRAAVEDGEYFKVIGAGDVAAKAYRRMNAATSVLVTEYPSESYVSKAFELPVSETYFPNVFSLDELKFKDRSRITTGADILSTEVIDDRVNGVITSTNSAPMSVYWNRISRKLINSTVLSAGITITYWDAMELADNNSALIVMQYDSGGKELTSFRATKKLPNSMLGISSPTRISLNGIAISPDTHYFLFRIDNYNRMETLRVLKFRDMTLVGGASSHFVAPDELTQEKFWQVQNMFIPVNSSLENIENAANTLRNTYDNSNIPLASARNKDIAIYELDNYESKLVYSNKNRWNDFMGVSLDVQESETSKIIRLAGGSHKLLFNNDPGNNRIELRQVFNNGTSGSVLLRINEDGFMILQTARVGNAPINEYLAANFSNITLISHENSYTTSIGSSWEVQNIEGDSIYFRYFSDSRGGIWKFTLDKGEPGERTKLFSTWSAKYVYSNEKILFDDIGPGTHNIEAVFMGPDKSKPLPSEPARGWFKGGGIAPISARTTSLVSPVTVMGSSVAEFAVSSKVANSTDPSDWVPRHGGRSGSTRNVVREYFVDGEKVLTLPDSLEGFESFVVRQKYDAYNTRETNGNTKLWTGLLTHTFTKSGLRVENYIDSAVDWLGGGYIAMFPVLTSAMSSLLVDDTVYPISATDVGERRTTLENVPFGAIAYNPSTKLVSAISIRSKSEVTAAPDDTATFFTERTDGVAKLYWHKFRGEVNPAGNKYYSAVNFAFAGNVDTTLI